MYIEYIKRKPTMKNSKALAFTAFVATATIGSIAAFAATYDQVQFFNNYGEQVGTCNEQGWSVEKGESIMILNADQTYVVNYQGEQETGTWTKVNSETLRVGDGTVDNTIEITPLCTDGSFRF